MTGNSDEQRTGGNAVLKRSHRYTWMPNGWTNSTALGSAEGGTEFLTIGVPDDFVAVRVGFANINQTPWTVRKVIACASSSSHDFFNPLDQAGETRPANAWSTLTFPGSEDPSQCPGSDDAALVTARHAISEIAVRGNNTARTSGESSTPAWTFTDWVPCASVGTDPATCMRVLMLRTLVPGNQIVTFTTGRMVMGELTGLVADGHGYGYFLGGLKHDTDLVTNPSPVALPGITTKTVDANHLVNGQIACLVQVRTRNAGIVGLVTGDNHQAGTSVSSCLNNFMGRCMFGIGLDTIGTLPIGVAMTAAGGLAS